MLKRILLLVDSGEQAGNARALALQLAQTAGAAVTGLALIDASARLSGDRVPGPIALLRGQQDSGQQALAIGQLLLQLFAEQARCAGVSCSSQLQETTHPLQILREQVNAHDLLVLATESYLGELRHAHDTGWLEAFLHDAARPLLLPGDGHGSGPVLLAYDGSACSARSLQQFIWLSLAPGAPLRVVSVHHDRLEAERLAAEGAGYLALHGRTATALGLESTAPADAVLDAEVQDSDACLLVMGAFGHRSWVAHLFGSTTRRLLGRRGCPVLMCS